MIETEELIRNIKEICWLGKRQCKDMASAIVDKVKSVIQPEDENGKAGHCCSALSSGPGYASPEQAQKGPREKLLYITAVYTGSDLWTANSFPLCGVKMQRSFQ